MRNGDDRGPLSAGADRTPPVVADDAADHRSRRGDSRRRPRGLPVVERAIIGRMARFALGALDRVGRGRLERDLRSGTIVLAGRDYIQAALAAGVGPVLRTSTTGCARRHPRRLGSPRLPPEPFSSPVSRAPCAAPADLRLEPRRCGAARPVAMLDDETLRDGLQSPSVRTPDHRREDRASSTTWTRLGIDTADIGLPGAGPRGRVRRRAAWRARSATAGLRSAPTAPRARMIADIKPIAEISSGPASRSNAAPSSGRAPSGSMRKAGRSTTCSKCTEEALTFAVKRGPHGDVSSPRTRRGPIRNRSRLLFTTAIRAGASRLCIADTVGHATPNGAKARRHGS